MIGRIPMLKHGPDNTLPLTAVIDWAQVLTCVISLAIACPTLLSAQYGYFGQNKIHYRRFDWRVLRGEDRHLYYHSEEEELGPGALASLAESYGTVAQPCDHHV